MVGVKGVRSVTLQLIITLVFVNEVNVKLNLYISLKIQTLIFSDVTYNVKIPQISDF